MTSTLGLGLGLGPSGRASERGALGPPTALFGGAGRFGGAGLLGFEGFTDSFTKGSKSSRAPPATDWPASTGAEATRTSSTLLT